MVRARKKREGDGSPQRPSEPTRPPPPNASTNDLLPLPLGLSRAWMGKWLQAFERTMSPTAACAACNIDRSTAYDARRTDRVFAKAWEDRRYAGLDTLESCAYVRATKGWLEPVFQGGEQVGTKRKFSDRMAEFMLRSRNPGVFNKAAGDKGDETTKEDRAAELRELVRSMDFSVQGAPPEPATPGAS